MYEAERVRHAAREVELRRKILAAGEYWQVVKQVLEQRSHHRSNDRVEQYMQLIWMVIFEEKSNKDVDRFFDIKPNTRHKWLQRGREHLRPYASDLLNQVIAGRSKH